MAQRFKTLSYQIEAVKAVTDCFTGQPYADMQSLLTAGGAMRNGQQIMAVENLFANAPLALSAAQIFANLQAVQKRAGIIPRAETLCLENDAPNLDIEMETGTGKTYCYLKTAFELNRLYGWSKFIIIVPTTAIREGVNAALKATAPQFQADYGRQANFFVYDGSRINEVSSFASDAGLQVMIITMQAFNTRKAGARIIDKELDNLQSRRPIELIQSCRPILVIDEPQRQEGSATREKLAEFKPLMILRYSATHKTDRGCVYRLDAADAYNRKLVKKIAVWSIEAQNAGGFAPYLYLEGIDTSPDAPPKARLHFERRLKSGDIRRQMRLCGQGDDLFCLSGELEVYKGLEIIAVEPQGGFAEFTKGEKLHIGEARGNVEEGVLRRLQIRAAIRAHLETERRLFTRDIKALTLFFIDKVAHYRVYNPDGSSGNGEYARIFEEEYEALRSEFLESPLSDAAYKRFLERDNAGSVHAGYFSQDKKGRMTDSRGKKNEDGGSDDADAYDLILKDKERLLSRDTPARFIFSHSILSEGWDNTNIFTLCMLKEGGSGIRRRQEVGRGMRLCVNARGERQDNPDERDAINVLTVIANESYQKFCDALQKDYAAAISPQARRMTAEFFTGREIENADGGKAAIDEKSARLIEKWLIKNDYIDGNDELNDIYREAARSGALALLPDDLKLLESGIFALLNNAAQNKIAIDIDNANERQRAFRNEKNFAKAEFQELWRRISRRAVYYVDYDTDRLIKDAADRLDKELDVPPLTYIARYGRLEDIDKAGGGFHMRGEGSSLARIETGASRAPYDILGRLGEAARLTRRTAAAVLSRVKPETFAQFARNPEIFITRAARLIAEAKFAQVTERLRYEPLAEQYDAAIFASDVPFYDRRFVADTPAKNIYDKALLDSQTEMDFAKALEGAAEVAVYAKLPRGFTIPTPIGGYNPDWAIAFNKGKVRHIYFIAETKGSAAEGDRRQEENDKIACARRWIAALCPEGSEREVVYDVVTSYSDLMSKVLDARA